MKGLNVLSFFVILVSILIAFAVFIYESFPNNPPSMPLDTVLSVSLSLSGILITVWSVIAAFYFESLSQKPKPVSRVRFLRSATLIVLISMVWCSMNSIFAFLSLILHLEEISIVVTSMFFTLLVLGPIICGYLYLLGRKIE